MKNKKIILFLVFILCITTIVLFILLPKKQTELLPYNVVVIVSDTLRRDVPGCYGGEAHTPHIDWLAQNGVLFEKAYSVAPWTSPSSVSIFSSNYPDVYKYGKRKSAFGEKISYFLPDQTKTLFETLETYGCDLRYLARNSNVYLDNQLQGFKKFKRLGELRKQEKQEIMAVTGDTGKKNVNRFLYPVIDYFLHADPKKRFFSLVWIQDPHNPYNPVREFYKKIAFDESTLPNEKKFYVNAKLHAFEKSPLSNNERAYLKKLYIAEVESVDQRIGFILKTLRHKKLLNRTIIIFTSDHGESFGSHNLYGHGNSYYENLIRIPLIFFGPRLPKGLRVHNLVSNIDLAPTIIDLLSVKRNPHKKIDGRSYKPLVLGEEMQIRDHVYLCAIDPFSCLGEPKYTDALIDGNFKLIVKIKEGFELYDLSKDPQELENIAHLFPDIIKKMFRKREKILAQIRKRNRKLIKKKKGDINLNKDEEKEAIEQLKTLGYID